MTKKINAQQAKAIIQDITDRGWVKIDGVYQNPSKAKLILSSSKPIKKKRSVIVRTGWITDSRNIKNRLERTDMFRMLIEKEFGEDLVWPEFFFDVDRLYRFDYAMPTYKGLPVRVAVEQNGGIHAKGNSGHSSAKGLQRDYDKNSLSASLGWVVITRTPRQLITSETITLIRKTIEQRI